MYNVHAMHIWIRRQNKQTGECQYNVYAHTLNAYYINRTDTRTIYIDIYAHTFSYLPLSQRQACSHTHTRTHTLSIARVRIHKYTLMMCCKHLQTTVNVTGLCVVSSSFHSPLVLLLSIFCFVRFSPHCTWG